MDFNAKVRNVQVSPRGKKLALCLPARVVKGTGLNEGDAITVSIHKVRDCGIPVDATRRQALERLRQLQRPLPKGFMFDREVL